LFLTLAWATSTEGNDLTIVSGLLKKTFFTLVALGFGLALSELTLKVLTWASPRIAYEIRPPWSNRALDKDPLLGYRLSPYFPGTDHRGYRNNNALQQTDVLAIGDSMTYGYTVPLSETWPYYLQQTIGWTVYNAGVGGYGPCEHLIVLRELMDLEPRVVVVALYLGNDISDAYTSVYLEERCLDLKSDDHIVLARLAEAREKGSLRQYA